MTDSTAAMDESMRHAISLDWRPSGSLPTLRARAQMLRAIRDFFFARNVLELETPTLGPGNVPDPEIDGLRLEKGVDVRQNIHLQTSPEFFLKRFLAAERQSCFQVCKAFRAGERGRLHHSEFTLLEWYRVAWKSAHLMQEVVDLVHTVHRALVPGTRPLLVEQISYRDLFRRHLRIDPSTCSDQQLSQLASDRGLSGLDRDGALAYLMTHHLERHFSKDSITIVDRFPAHQAALARLTNDHDGVQVADRFEIYWGQLELANGYRELTDATEQRARFMRDTNARAERGLADAGSQNQLLEALTYGLPSCSGVALGLDRLLMAVLGLEHIDQAMAFR